MVAICIVWLYWEHVDGLFMAADLKHRHLFALISAAGTGERMQRACPKQYLALLGKPVLCYSVDAFLACPEIEAVFIAIQQGDTWFGQLPGFLENGSRVHVLRCGGATRRETVLNGLEAMAPFCQPKDWILVHDAARPGLTPELIRRLIAAVSGTDGGILALPVADTVKRKVGDRVETLPREGLWLAQTPQMFPYAFLKEALGKYEQATDEAVAVEAAGVAPILVEGSLCNMKMTHPGDLALLEVLIGAENKRRGK